MSTRSKANRCHVHFTGHVQGVGFRFTTKLIASNYAVTGFVKNLRDGRVELVAEGDRSELNAFLHALEERLSDHIQNRQSDHLPANGEFTQFEIRH